VGETGSQGLQGITGSQGPTGAQGTTGPQGPSGISKRIESYSGTSDASGNVFYSWDAFPDIPNIQPVTYPPTSDLCVARLTAVSATGCTVQITQRIALTVLSLSVLSFASTPVSGITVKILVTET